MYIISVFGDKSGLDLDQSPEELQSFENAFYVCIYIYIYLFIYIYIYLYIFMSKI